MSKITELGLMSREDGIYLAIRDKVGGKERFLQWIETRQLFATIVEQLRHSKLYGNGVTHTIKTPDLELTLDRTAVIHKAEDLPIEFLMEFLKNYIQQEGWNDIDSNGNLIEKGDDLWQKQGDLGQKLLP